MSHSSGGPGGRGVSTGAPARRTMSPWDSRNASAMKTSLRTPTWNKRVKEAASVVTLRRSWTSGLSSASAPPEGDPDFHHRFCQRSSPAYLRRPRGTNTCQALLGPPGSSQVLLGFMIQDERVKREKQTCSDLRSLTINTDTPGTHTHTHTLHPSPIIIFFSVLDCCGRL